MNRQVTAFWRGYVKGVLIAHAIGLPILVVLMLSGCAAPAVQRHDVNVMWKDEAPAKVEQTFPVIHSEEPTPAEPLISIVGPTERAVGEMVVLTAKGESKGWSWTCAGKHAFETADGGQRLFFCTPKPGEYEFILAGYPPEAVKPEQVSHFVTIRGGVPPQPTPEPEPQPTPIPVPPPPHVSKVYALIVYESKSVTPEQSRVYTNLRDGPAAKYLKDKGHLLDIVDQNKHPATKFAPFKSLPEMLVLPLEGRYEAAPVWRGPMPATADGVVEQIKRMTQ